MVKQWPRELTNAKVILSTCAFWVQVHGLPLQNMKTVNAIKIRKFIGDDVLDIDNGDCPGIICHHHLRMRVVLDVSKPLVLGFHLPRPRLPSLGIKFLYERLADYCTLCGLIGHGKSFCPAPPPLGPHDMYGVSLRDYVYPGTRSPPSSRTICIPGDHRSLLCTEDLGLGFFLPAPSTGPTTTMQPPRCSPLKLVEEALSTPGFHPHL